MHACKILKKCQNIKIFLESCKETSFLSVDSSMTLQDLIPPPKLDFCKKKSKNETFFIYIRVDEVNIYTCKNVKNGQNMKKKLESCRETSYLFIDSSMTLQDPLVPQKSDFCEKIQNLCNFAYIQRAICQNLHARGQHELV